MPGVGLVGWTVPGRSAGSWLASARAVSRPANSRLPATTSRRRRRWSDMVQAPEVDRRGVRPSSFIGRREARGSAKGERGA